jgi:uncharacterized membrane protein
MKIRHKILLKNLLPLVVVTVVSAVLACAQETASITGVVSDPTGAVVPDVSVVLVNTSTSISYQTATNSVGSYLINSVLPGPGYKMT